MTIAQVEVITSVERRRRWSRAEKERLVAAALEPGANVSAVARQAGLHSSLLFRWRKELCGPAGATPAFAAVMIAPEPASSALPHRPGLIEIELAGARIRISGRADPATVAAVLNTIAGGRR